VAGLDRRRFALVSPEVGPNRSSLVVFTHREPSRNAAIHARLREAGILTAHRRGNIRVSPHLYNTSDEIDRALVVLNAG
jgi:selenocysteine lyase/cysteine desulfurase